MNGTRRQAALILGSLVTAGLLAGAATAGNPNGTPPGQATKTQSSSSTSTSKGKSTAPGQAKKSSKTTKSHGISSGSSAGVKPSNTTQKGTHAQAGSNQTKLYGNGKTAGQIAQQNGASSSTDLYGPGNSQPHKVAVCSKNGKTHYVDVHALKAHSSASCTSGSTAASKASAKANAKSAVSAVTQTTTAPATASIVLEIHSGVLAAVRILRSAAGALAPARSGSVLGAQHSTRTGGVLGAKHTLAKRVTGRAHAAKAVVRAASFTG